MEECYLWALRMGVEIMQGVIMFIDYMYSAIVSVNEEKNCYDSVLCCAFGLNIAFSILKAGRVFSNRLLKDSIAPRLLKVTKEISSLSVDDAGFNTDRLATYQRFERSRRNYYSRVKTIYWVFSIIMPGTAIVALCYLYLNYLNPRCILLCFPVILSFICYTANGRWAVRRCRKFLRKAGDEIAKIKKEQEQLKKIREDEKIKIEKVYKELAERQANEMKLLDQKKDEEIQRLNAIISMKNKDEEIQRLKAEIEMTPSHPPAMSKKKRRGRGRR